MKTEKNNVLQRSFSKFSRDELDQLNRFNADQQNNGWEYSTQSSSRNNATCLGGNIDGLQHLGEQMPLPTNQ